MSPTRHDEVERKYDVEPETVVPDLAEAGRCGLRAVAGRVHAEGGLLRHRRPRSGTPEDHLATAYRWCGRRLAPQASRRPGHPGRAARTTRPRTPSPCLHRFSRRCGRSCGTVRSLRSRRCPRGGASTRCAGQTVPSSRSSVTTVWRLSGWRATLPRSTGGSGKSSSTAGRRGCSTRWRATCSPPAPGPRRCRRSWHAPSARCHRRVFCLSPRRTRREARRAASGRPADPAPGQAGGGGCGRTDRPAGVDPPLADRCAATPVCPDHLRAAARPGGDRSGAR